jgi:hypothetical protein
MVGVEGAEPVRGEGLTIGGRLRSGAAMGVVELFGELGVLCEQALELGRELARPV